MKLKRSSKIVRWAYLTSDYVPRQTTLCNLFWRSVLLTPGILSIMLFGFLTPALVGIKSGLGWWSIALLVIWPLVILAAWATIELIYWLQRTTAATPLINETVWAYKNKVCPIIELEHD